MSNQFNLNNFLQEYRGYNERQYTAAENGREAMAQRELKKAEEAVNQEKLLSLTLSEKLAELGVGDRVVQQLGDTAKNIFKDLIVPFTDYLEKHENIFDQNKYTAEIQSYAKQMFFAKEALAADAASRENGQGFVYDM